MLSLCVLHYGHVDVKSQKTACKGTVFKHKNKFFLPFRYKF